MYTHPDDYLAMFRANERDLHRAAALEKQARRASEPRQPWTARLASRLTLHSLRPRPA